MRSPQQIGWSTGDSQAVRVCDSARKLLCLLALLSLVSTAWGAGSPTVGNPVGSGTVPPSSYGSGLINTPSPIDSSSNQVITGNVGGGKHFRGSIPYGSTTNFGAPLGSTRLDSFLRYSTVPGESGERPTDYSPFYSPTGTMTTIRPGQSSVFAPVSPRIAGTVPRLPVEQPADVTALPQVLQPQISTGEVSATVDGGLSTWQRQPSWPMTRTPEEMRRIISGELAGQLPNERPVPPRDGLMTPEDYRRELEQLQRGLDRVKADASLLQQQSLPADGSLSDTFTQGPLEPIEPSGPGAIPGVPPESQPVPTAPNRLVVPPQLRDQDAGRIPDVIPLPGQEQAAGIQAGRLAETRWDVSTVSVSPEESPSTLKERIDAVFRTQVPGQAGGGREQNVGALPAARGVQETARALAASSKLLEKPAPAGSDVSSAGPVPVLPDPPATTSGGNETALSPGEDDLNEPQPDVPPPSSGESVLGKYENASPLAQERFARYMKAAELYFRQGRYYRAAESFTLASMYQPADARAYLGKGHALLAAGEYVSSAVFLAKAIEIDPQRTLAKADLVETLGGPDAFVERINDLERCAEAGASPQLHFLLAYVNYQMDRPAEAGTALAAAEKGLPPSVAISLLKAALGR